MLKAAVIGAGAWGATMADVLSRNGHGLKIWDKSGEFLDRLESDRKPFGVPELILHEKVAIVRGLKECLTDVEVVIVVVPAQKIRVVGPELERHFAELYSAENRPVVVLLSKGIDVESLRPLSAVLKESLPNTVIGAISGPCIAREVAQGIPTSVVAAAEHEEWAVRIRNAIVTDRFRAYTQHDLMGVELGGALKNIIAIAAGIGDGLGYGANTKATVLSRGLAEITRLAVQMGAEARTMYGLAGLGDLSVTCFSPHSRNRTFGEYLGRGLTPDEARDKIGMTVEGEPTARAALKLAEQYDIEMPITEAIVRVCDGQWKPEEAVENLMTRTLKDEFGGRGADCDTAPC